MRPAVKFIVSDWGIKLTPAYRVVVPASQAANADTPVRHDNPMPDTTIVYPAVSDYEFGYCVLSFFR